MTIERKLSKVQMRAFVGFTQQRQELVAAIQEVMEAEQAQLEMLRIHFDLPEGKYQVRQEQNNDVILFRVELAAEAVKTVEMEALDVELVDESVV